MKLSKHFNKISVKVALVITVLVVGLFVVLNFVVVNRGERVFNDVYGVVSERGELPPGDTPFIFPLPNRGFPFSQPSAGVMLTPREHFKTRFQSSLLIIGLVALLGTLGIGFLISRIISRPLEKLESGMKKLRQSHYRLRLEENDSEEFNALTNEFNRLAEELERIENLRKNLISDASHELRTPLSSLTAQLEGIRDGVLTLDENRLKLLTEQVGRLTEMTEGLQDYAHLRSQVIKPQLKNFRLKEMVIKIREYYKNELDSKKIAVQLNFSDDYPLSADPRLIERVFTNLFDNAIRYSKAKNITLTADQQQIVFSDDGIGVPREHLNDIFERFFRLEKSRSRKTGGMGLGLAIIKEIIEAHNWKISAQIPQNNQGIEFVINLKEG